MDTDKLLYFSTGDGANLSGEAYIVPLSRFREAHPVSSTTLDLIFDSSHGDRDYVRLTIASNTHKAVMDAINRVVDSGTRNFGYGKACVIICDKDNDKFCTTDITDCVIYLGRSSSGFNAQNITGTSKVLVNTTGGNFDSSSLASVHDSTDATVNLYYASQVGTDITSTTVLAAETEAASGSSVTLTVDTVAATADAFVDEKVYKSDGTLFGTCTARNSATELVFSGGLSSAITNDDVLYTGTRYYVLKAVSVPVGQTLILDDNEVNFNSIDYSLYITLGAGSIDLITRQ